MAKIQQLLKCEYADCVLAYNQQKILTQSLKKQTNPEILVLWNIGWTKYLKT